jgi:Endosomal/lysosomal potassium channel TMEM175
MGGRDAETQIGVVQRWRIRHRDYAPHLNVHLDRDQELTLQTLVSLGPEMLAFALTFVIVGVYWVSHHSMMHMIKAVDRRLLWLNLLLLACRRVHSVSRISALTSYGQAFKLYLSHRYNYASYA